MTTHLEHPTQANACGAPASCGSGVGAVAFLVSADRCRRCERIAIAEAAGRPVFRGLEPAAVEADTYIPPVLSGLARGA